MIRDARTLHGYWDGWRVTVLLSVPALGVLFWVGVYILVRRYWAIF